MHANATHSLLTVSTFDCHSDNGFASRTAASFARFFGTYEKFIHFNAPGEFFTILADGATSKLLEPVPSRTVAGQAQKLFEINGIYPGFASRESAHGLEPVGDRLFGTAHNRTGDQRMLVFTLGADIKVL